MKKPLLTKHELRFIRAWHNWLKCVRERGSALGTSETKWGRALSKLAWSMGTENIIMARERIRRKIFTRTVGDRKITAQRHASLRSLYKTLNKFQFS